MTPLTSNAPPKKSSTVGFVAIGRNEGERLQACLLSIQKNCPIAPVVYVDSGSSDNSVAFAQDLDFDVVDLDLSTPFTAARARNAGFNILLANHPELKYVQFMDGDCELQPGWIEAATAALQSDESIGIVSGRRMEKFPEASIYNTLIDIEWNTPIGATRAVLGDMCIKTALFKTIGGFSEEIIAAEDDDLCIRARGAGSQIYRIDAPMSRHDANIMRLSQWYRRAKRAGHGFANINHLHGGRPDRYFHRELRSIVFWGGIVPLGFFLFLFVYPIVSSMFLLGYLAIITKTMIRRLERGDQTHIAFAYSVLIFTGKIPELIGAIQYWKNRMLSRQHELIEYK
jgi:GT2 family glycosyltransferase